MTEPQETEPVPPELAEWKPNYLPDDLAPPLDHERLRALVRRQLPERSVRTLLELTLRFHCWQRAYQDVLAEEVAILTRTDNSGDDSEAVSTISPENSSRILTKHVNSQSDVVPFAMALGSDAQNEGEEKLFNIGPELCEWKPMRPQALADSEGRIAVRSKVSGTLSVTIGGFLFDSDEYQVEAVLFAADKSELARANLENPHEPTLVLIPKESRQGASSGNELQITSSYKPESGHGWIAIVRLRLD